VSAEERSFPESLQARKRNSPSGQRQPVTTQAFFISTPLRFFTLWFSSTRFSLPGTFARDGISIHWIAPESLGGLLDFTEPPPSRHWDLYWSPPVISPGQPTMNVHALGAGQTPSRRSFRICTFGHCLEGIDFIGKNVSGKNGIYYPHNCKDGQS
jgi:hypothetical protein